MRRLTLDELDALPEEAAVALFLACCGSRRWAREMAACRPFGGRQALFAAASEVWDGLGSEDWLEAFAAHPRIGESQHGEAASARFSRHEQSAAAGAPATVLERLAAGNRAYEKRFDFVFLICATGKSAAEMLAALEERLGHDHRTELEKAAREQSAITRLRLEKVLS